MPKAPLVDFRNKNKYNHADYFYMQKEPRWFKPLANEVTHHIPKRSLNKGDQTIQKQFSWTQFEPNKDESQKMQIQKGRK